MQFLKRTKMEKVNGHVVKFGEFENIKIMLAVKECFVKHFSEVDALGTSMKEALSIVAKRVFTIL